MAAAVETMFYTREKPWHGLGTRVEEAPASADALRLAGLDWQVLQEPIFTDQGEMITGYRIRRRFRLRTPCSEAACVMRQQALYRMEGRFGFLRAFQESTSFPVKGSRPILYFRIHMTEAAR